jgi:hypothetical protein
MDTNLQIDDFSLLAGVDIYSKELNLSFHQPKLYDIAAFGLSKWQAVINLLLWDKENLKEENKKNLEQLSNFDCIYLLLQNRDQNTGVCRYETNFLNFCTLVFPEFTVLIHQKQKFQLVFQNKATEEIIIINKDNYDIFLFYIETLFLKFDCQSKDQYNIDKNDQLAKRIKEKLDRRHKILAKNDSTKGKHSILYNMVSSLALDSPSGLNELYNLTLYQFYEQVGRYHKKVAYNAGLSAMLAGAQDIELEDWYGDI